MLRFGKHLILLMVASGAALESCNNDIFTTFPEGERGSRGSGGSGLAGSAGDTGGTSGTSPEGGEGGDGARAGMGAGEGGASGRDGDAGDAGTGGQGGVDACHPCDLWNQATCDAPLGCIPLSDGSGCVQCDVTGTGDTRGLCNRNSDCSPGNGCAEGICRDWCALDAAVGERGACSTGEECVSYPQLDGTGAGVCLPCNECNPALATTCGVGLTCSTAEGCAVCVEAGSGQVGETCAGQSDCARGLSCISQVCRQVCLRTAQPGQPGACEEPFLCTDQLEDSPEFGTCLPCGECGLFGPPSCSSGFKCLSRAPGCEVCIPTGTRAPGTLCTDHSQCQNGLSCVGDFCRAHCLPDASGSEPGACSAGFRCIDLPDDPNLGSCMPCGECGAELPCPTGSACRSVDGCDVCMPQPRDRPPGTRCTDHGQCISNNCVDDVCRNPCPPTSSSSQCESGESCGVFTGADGDPIGFCLSCGECNVLTQTGCPSTHKCLAPAPTCQTCYPRGGRREGESCGNYNDCQSPLNCANGICRPFCDRASTATCPSPRSCFGSNTLPSNVGQCLPCGECTLWSDNPCAAADLKCNVYGTCTICEGVGQGGGEGSACGGHGDCTRDYHCHSGYCREYCRLGGAATGEGSCPTGRQCTSVSGLSSLGTGVCMP
jgi:hypothetical protein